MGVPTSTPTKVAYGVVFLAVSIALYGVYTGQDVKQVAIPAFQWSQTHAHALLARYVFRTNASNVRQHRSILGTFVCWMHPRIGTQPAAADGKIPQASTQHTEAFEPAACQLHGPVVDCGTRYRTQNPCTTPPPSSVHLCRRRACQPRQPVAGAGGTGAAAILPLFQGQPVLPVPSVAGRRAVRHARLLCGRVQGGGNPRPMARGRAAAQGGFCTAVRAGGRCASKAHCTDILCVD